MWDFGFGKAVGLVARTAPFVVLRLAIVVGIGIAYISVVGVGAVVGYGFARAFSASSESGSLMGGFLGFGIVSAALYFAREYILYLVKAGHIAVMVELYDGHDAPSGKSQLGFGADFVKSHFTESSVLFGVDQIIKGVLAAFFRTINFFTAFLPVPALQSLMRMAENFVRMSLTYVDEIILAYLIRTRTANPWQTAKDGLILYAQNYKHFLKNAAWLSVFLWLLTAAIFVLLLGPAAVLVAFLPGMTAVWTFAAAILFAWGIKVAVLEPIAIAALMEVYFKTIEGQKPNPEWEARLDGVSSKFRDLTDRAADWAGASPKGGNA
jgi:hypothetical protein